MSGVGRWNSRWVKGWGKLDWSAADATNATFCDRFEFCRRVKRVACRIDVGGTYTSLSPAETLCQIPTPLKIYPLSHADFERQARSARIKVLAR